MSAALVPQCRDEVVGLHEFFVDWFAGHVSDSAVVFARFTAAVHANFTMVLPSGQLVDKAAVAHGLRSAYGSQAGRDFRIEIHDVTERHAADGVVVLTYQEWQFEGPRVGNARTSTAVFVAAPHAPNGVVWRHLHETFLGPA